MKIAMIVALAVPLLSACNDSRYQIAAGGGDSSRVWRLDTRSGEVTMCVVVQQGAVRCIQSFAELKSNP